VTSLLLIQLGLPLLALAWLSFLPLASRVGRALQLLGIAVMLLVLHLAGLWLFPPWWMPWIYWFAFAVALFRARRWPTYWVPRGSGWIGALAGAVLLGYFGMLLADVLAGRRPPAAPAVDLAFPLPDGQYYVANGGSAELISSHVRTLARTTERQRIFYGQSYGVDLVGLNGFGMHADGVEPADPRRYAIYGTPVLAPCAGSIAAARDGVPDRPVPEPDPDPANMAGNHVILECGGIHLLLAHFRPGSVRVSAGQPVAVGDRLGEVGNSGNSGAPHLHIHAQRPGTSDAPFSGDPLPITFTGHYPVRGDRF
jgi:hypothetical protein